MRRKRRKEDPLEKALRELGETVRAQRAKGHKMVFPTPRPEVRQLTDEEVGRLMEIGVGLPRGSMRGHLPVPKIRQVKKGRKR